MIKVTRKGALRGLPGGEDEKERWNTNELDVLLVEEDGVVGLDRIRLISLAVKIDWKGLY